MIRRVRHESSLVSVEIEGSSHARYLVRFSGVESLISHEPEGMVLYVLSEMEALPPLREFHFAKSEVPDEGSKSRLEVIA
jgi:hypothetical protein